MTNPSVRLGADIGGTFTDVILVSDDGAMTTRKVFSDREDYAASVVQADFPPDMIHIAVDASGAPWVEKKQIALPDLYTVLTNRMHSNEKLPVFIAGDAETRHGDMVKVLEFVRKAGAQKVSFTVVAEHSPQTPKS